MRTVTIHIAPNQAYELTTVGDYVRVRLSAVDLNIENPDTGENIEVSQGDDFQFTPFKNLRISHASGSEQTVKLIISTGKKAGSSQVSGNIAGNVAVSNMPASQGVFAQGRADISNVDAILIAADAARRFLMIQNNDAAAVLRVAMAGGAASPMAGFRVQPGGVLEIPNYCLTNAIHVCMETATAAVGNVEFVTG